MNEVDEYRSMVSGAGRLNMQDLLNTVTGGTITLHLKSADALKNVEWQDKKLASLESPFRARTVKGVFRCNRRTLSWSRQTTGAKIVATANATHDH